MDRSSDAVYGHYPWPSNTSTPVLTPAAHQPSAYKLQPATPRTSQHGHRTPVRPRPAYAPQGRDHRLRALPRRRRRPQKTPPKPHDTVMPQLPYLKAQGPCCFHFGLFLSTSSSSSSRRPVALVRPQTPLFEVHPARPCMYPAPSYPT